MIINRTQDKQLFWVFQLSGWIIFPITDLYRNYTELSKVPIFYYWLLSMAFGFIVTLALRKFYKRYFTKNTSIYKKLFVIVISSFIAGVVWLLLNWITHLIFEAINFRFIEAFDKIIKYEILNLHILMRIQDTMYVLLAWSLLYFGLKTWFSLANEKQKSERAFLLAQQAQLQLLRYQINPHFLFNSLNSIQGLIHENTEVADKMITELSDFLRYSLTYSGRSHVLLEEELSIVDKYLRIEKIRFEKKISYKIKATEEAKKCEVIGFILQPLVENAVKHGIITSKIPLSISVDVRVLSEKLLIEVSNSGRWLENNDNGVGIENVKERLKNAYAQQFRFIVSEAYGNVIIRIEIPANTLPKYKKT